MTRLYDNTIEYIEDFAFRVLGDSLGSRNVNAKVSAIVIKSWKEECQAKISNFWVKTFVEKDVGSFNVSMYYWWSYFFVQICKSTCNP